MNEQNINPKKNEQQSTDGNLDNTGLNAWNDRLDQNLEPETEGDVQADENAEDFQEEADREASKNNATDA